MLAAFIFLQRTLTERAADDLRQTLRGASGYVEQEKSRLQGAAELISSDPEIGAAVTRRTVLIDKLAPYYTALHVDSLEVVDRSGRVVVSMEDTSTYGYSAIAMTDVQQALSGLSWVGLDRNSGQQDTAAGWAIRASVPLQVHSQIVGVVVVGRQLSSAFADELGNVLNADVNLIVGRKRTGSTIKDRAGLSLVGMDEPPALLKRISTGRTSIAKVDKGHGTVLSGLIPLKDSGGRWIGAIEVVRSLDTLYRLIEDLSFLLLWIGILIVIGGTVGAFYVAGRFTRRLLALQDVASQVVTHPESDAPLHDLQGTLPVGGKDEVAALARSFESMMTTLDERMAAIASLYSASQARVRELTGLAEVARLLTASRSIEETLNMLSRHVSGLVGSKAVAIYVPADDSTTILFGGHGLPEGYAALISNAILVPGNEDSPLASQAAYWTGRPAYRKVEVQGERFRAVQEVAAESGWGAATAFPLRLQDRTIGVLTCYTADSTPLPDSDMSLLTTVADQVAVAVENVKLYDRAQDVAALEERARLARELHDSVTQALFSMTLRARAVQLRLEREGIEADSPAARDLRDLSELTQGALAEMRSLIFELRPGALREEGLVAALQKQTAAIGAREGIEVTVDAPDARLPLKPSVEEHLYRLAQEALHNVVKHAQAEHVLVRLEVGPEVMTMEIRDDGTGFDPAAVPPGHLGLHTMAERTGQIGGSIEVLSAVGEGTTVRVRIPCVRATGVETCRSA